MRDKLLLYGEKIRNIDIKLQTITKAYHETLNRIDLFEQDIHGYTWTLEI